MDALSILALLTALVNLMASVTALVVTCCGRRYRNKRRHAYDPEMAIDSMAIAVEGTPRRVRQSTARW